MSRGELALHGGKKTIEDQCVLQHSWRSRGMVEGLTDYTGAQYAFCVSSGTAALISGLRAADCGPGDEVLCVAFTWIASVNCVIRVGATPVFVDIDPRTFTMDVEDARLKITSRTKAIIPVDFYGHPAPIPELMALAEEHGLIVIEDACQAIGSAIDSRPAGSLAHFTAFSWSGKPVSAPGGGGAFVTNSRELYERALLAGQHPTVIMGLVTDPELRQYAGVGGYGDNFRPVNADVALRELLTLDIRNDARIRNCDYLTEKLSEIPGISPPYVRPGYKHVYHYYTCLWDETQWGISRDRFCEALNAEGVPTIAYVHDAMYYFDPVSKPLECRVPLHLRKWPYPEGTVPLHEPGYLPVTEEIAEREFNWMQTWLSAPNGEREMQKIVDAVKKVCDHVDELKD